jgi:glycosyltransferase 2 family protein
MTVRIVRVLGTMALLALVLVVVAPKDIVQALGMFQPIWFGLAVAALVAQILLSALRWQLTARGLGLQLGRFWSLREYGLSVASNTFLPGGVMGDLARVVRTRHHGWQMATASVVIERFAGQIALGVLALAGLILWRGLWTGVGAGLLAALVGIGIARLAPGVWPLLVRSWGASGLWQRQVGLTLAILGLNVLGFWAAVRATGLALSPDAAIALIPLTLFAMLLPISINGWGVREAVAATLWPLWGIEAAQAVAGTMVFGLACMAAALLGLLPMIARAPSAVTLSQQDHAP